MAKTRDDVMCIRIPSDEKAVIKQIADLEDRSMTDMVLFFMRSGVAAYQAAKAPATPATPATPAKATKAKATKAKAKK
jgi:ribosomal protein L12E/L44/L45/RPP1/RPP2